MADQQSKSVDFGRPPVVEVVVGVGFNPVLGLTAPFFGKLWDFLGSEFPRVEQHNPIMRRTTESFTVEPADLPIRCWYLSGDGSRLVQVQNNMLVFNWRRPDEDEKYPEYTNIKPEFFDQLKRFEKFASEQLQTSIRLNRYELSYVNIIPNDVLEPHLPVPGDVLVDHVRSKLEKRFLPEPSGFEWTTDYPIEKDMGKLMVRATTAHERSEPDRKLVRLELSALWGSPREDAPLETWLDLAHDYIVEGFAELTDKVVQREVWKQQ